MSRNRKLIFMLFSLACFIAMGVCVIVDLAITRKITWAAYPLLSIPFGWMVLSPLFIQKYGVILSPCALSLLVFPYLYFMEKITPVSDWFSPLGLPIAVTGIILGWATYLLLRFVKINLWYKAAVFVFLAGVIFSPIINHFADAFTGTEPSFLNYFINIFSCVAASAALGILGYRKSKASTMDGTQ